MSKHPDMAGKLEDIERALRTPLRVIPHRRDPTKRNYYSYLKPIKRYVLVAVKYLNGTGLVITSFLTRTIRRK